MPFTPLPQTTLATEFAATPAAITDHLRPMIVGPVAKLLRFSKPTEKALTLLDDYDFTTPTEYDYPGAVVGAIEDLDYVVVRIDDALLQYYSKLNPAAPAITIPSGYLNRIKSATTVYKTGNGTNRNAMFYDRDVTVGDVVDITGTVSAVNYSVRSRVTGFVAEVVAASVEAAVEDAGNANTQGGSSSQSQTAGTDNDVNLNSLSAGSYNGLATGDINETYVVEVTTGGAPATARITVTSASGNDDVLTPFAPSAYGVATNIGTRGLTGTWGNTVDDFVIGQKWTVLVSQAFTSPVPTSAGTYTGELANTYIVRVSVGGTYASGLARIVVTSALGVDASGPTAVVAAATPYAIGTLGATIAFSATALCEGDVYSVEVIPPGEGEIRTLVLADSVPSGLAPATDLAVKLYIKHEPAVIAHQRVSDSGVYNYELAAGAITINDDIEAYDSTYTDSGVELPLPIVEGTVYVDTRQWLPDIAVGTVTTQADIVAAVGQIDPDNPLAFGLECARLNASESLIGYAGVDDPDDTASWSTALAGISFLADTFNIVPLSQDTDVLDLFKTHVDSQSDPTVALFRCYWQSLVLRPSIVVVDSTTTDDDNDAMGTVTTNGSNNVVVTCTTGNVAFLTDEVAAGDVFRYVYAVDGWGNVTYNSYEVASVTSENQLVLVAPGTAIPYPVSAKFEIYRNQSKAQQATDLQARIVPYADALVRNVWPDQVGGLPGHFLCAALAGESSGIPSHQGMRNTEVVMPAGYASLSRYNALQAAGINALAENGCWIVATTSDGTLYSKAAVTTDPTSLQTSEEMVVRNGYAIQAYVQDNLSGYIGTANASDDMALRVQNEVGRSLRVLRTVVVASNLGTVVQAITVEPVATRDTVLRDHIVVSYTVQVPAPLNSVDITQVIVL